MSTIPYFQSFFAGPIKSFLTEMSCPKSITKAAYVTHFLAGKSSRNSDLLINLECAHSVGMLKSRTHFLAISTYSYNCLPIVL